MSMPQVWSQIQPGHLGFPKFPASSVPVLKGRHVSWIPYTKTTGTADYYWIIRSPAWIRQFVDKGGDPATIVVHHLSYDAGVINPLWNKEYFKKWMPELKAMGVQHIVSPDFSAWTGMPFVAQLYNFYRSLVVACDFAHYGFKVIPNVAGGSKHLHDFNFKMWPENLPSYVVDCQHIGRPDKIKKSEHAEAFFWRGSTVRVKRFDKAELVFLWSGSENYVQQFEARYPACPTTWVKSEMYMRRKLIKATNATTKGKKKKKKKAAGGGKIKG